MGNQNFAKHQAERLGQKRMMNCNEEAEIIAYRGARDIDVRFASGRIVTHREYDDFLTGTISGYGGGNRLGIDGRIGESKKMNCGLTGTIVGYRCTDDIDVKMSDDLMVNSTYSRFKSGSVSGRGPGFTRLQRMIPKRLGLKAMMKNGLEAEIIAYRNNRDMDVRLSNGCVVTGCTYGNFKNGLIRANTKRLRKKDATGEN